MIKKKNLYVDRCKNSAYSIINPIFKNGQKIKTDISTKKIYE